MSGGEGGCSYVIRGAAGEVFAAGIPDADGGNLLLTVDQRTEAGALSVSLWLAAGGAKPTPLASLDIPRGCLAGLEYFLRSAYAPGRQPVPK